jgi:hypothetical protein
MGNHPKKELAKFERGLLHFAVLEPIVSKYGDFRKKKFLKIWRLSSIFFT